MKKVLIVGGGGMLGHKLYQTLQPEFEVYTTVRGLCSTYESLDLFERDRVFENIDLSAEERIANVIRGLKPDIIINGAGIVKQVRSAKNAVETITLNSLLPHRLHELAGEIGARLILVSTDCVFSGSRGNYAENDTPDAADLYGRSKLLGEIDDQNCLTLRTSIIGRELSTKHGLLEWFLSNGSGSVKGFGKAIFSGFPTVVFSQIIKGILTDHPDLTGLYHVSSSAINKLELLGLINERFDAGVKIVPSDELVIDRSLDSSRFRSETRFEPLEWPEMIDILAEDAKLNARIYDESTRR
jgi:dTDP-4-dehydrorhamnose reductase